MPSRLIFFYPAPPPPNSDTRHIYGLHLTCLHHFLQSISSPSGPLHTPLSHVTFFKNTPPHTTLTCICQLEPPFLTGLTLYLHSTLVCSHWLAIFLRQSLPTYSIPHSGRGITLSQSGGMSTSTSLILVWGGGREDQNLLNQHIFFTKPPRTSGIYVLGRWYCGIYSRGALAYVAGWGWIMSRLEYQQIGWRVSC